MEMAQVDEIIDVIQDAINANVRVILDCYKPLSTMFPVPVQGLVC